MTAETPTKTSVTTATASPAPSSHPGGGAGGPGGRPGGPGGGRGGPGGGRGGGRGGRRNRSRFALQMEEKQNLKLRYGIREEQLTNYFRQAQRASEQTGDALIKLLELRLDNAVFRAGFAVTRAAARQMCSHRMFEVNNHPVTIPSRALRVGDVITLRENKRGKPLFANFQKSLQNASVAPWLEIDAEDFSFTVASDPEAKEAAIGMNIRVVVEYFSRKV